MGFVQRNLRRTVLGFGTALLLGAGVLTTPAAATAEAKVVPVQVTGPVSERFNMVFLGDGYTEAELPKFRSNVDKHLNVLWSIEPFKTYRSYINVFTVETPSPESGVDCDPKLDSPRKNTVLDMGFWGGCAAQSPQRLLVVDTGKANKYADLVTGTASGNRQIVALANSDTYGGAGGPWATASGGNALSSLITPHELGHSLGGLDDEYDYYQRGQAGAPYTGKEPGSIHHTLLTEQQMRQEQAKWWRWLGEPSESGGKIGRYEGGSYAASGIWRPSRHSMMKSLGYDFDQISRERMTQRIAGKVNLLSGGTPGDKPVGTDRPVTVQTLHPTDHALNVDWTLDGSPVPEAKNKREFDFTGRWLWSGKHTLTATVTDPTPFVRDPAVRDSAALTRSRTWTVDTAVTSPPASTVDFAASSPTDKPVRVGGNLYAEPNQPAKVRWTVDGRSARTAADDRDLIVPAGAKKVTATVGDQSRTWTVDSTAPTVDIALSTKDGEGPIGMKLTGKDDQPGYVVNQFRLDGDGWHTYYGWPTDAEAPFQFTATGTEVDGLVYGNLGPEGMSTSSFVQRKPGYGRHTIEYRAVDAAGNVSATRSVQVTLRAPR
ncbi:peptidase [Pseudonocardiaceae bacterium YIM PH 21723]|nr:peptidase [Pseudonocardiaceae bacterium YIM PH 21723]